MPSIIARSVRSLNDDPGRRTDLAASPPEVIALLQRMRTSGLDATRALWLPLNAATVLVSS